MRALTDPRVIVLCAIYFAIITVTYGVTFFLPIILKGLNFSDWQIGLLTAVPYVVGTVGMCAWSWSSDRRNERRWHFVIAALVTAVGLTAAGLSSGSLWTLAAASVATIGLYGNKPPFWAMPSEFLTGPAAAAGIALINSIGNLGGFVGPYVLGWLKSSTGSYEGGLYFLAACALASGMIALVAIRPSQQERGGHRPPGRPRLAPR